MLTLDARLELSEIKHLHILNNVETWIDMYCRSLGHVHKPVNGVVFEVRQGYKSKDSKRQNADIDNATVAWSYGYLPIFAIFSSQIDSDLVTRYRNNRCGILIGTTISDPTISLFAFFENVLEYDLAGFFSRNENKIQLAINEVLHILLGGE